MEIIGTSTQVIEDSIKAIFRHIGENPYRPGLVDTPARMIKMWSETMRGYDEAKQPKITTFQNGADGICYNGLITDSGSFHSTCEHHFMPFFGQYYFGYVPDKKILGLSKVARVVDYFSARLQIQERLCSDIVNCLHNAVLPRAIGIVMKGEHLCKTMRGAKKQGVMTASFFMGEFENNSDLRGEFLRTLGI